MTAGVGPEGGPGPAAERPDDAGSRPGPLGRLRSSLLLKILAGLVVVVVGASMATAFLETRLIRGALDDQSARITAGNLRVLKQAYAVRERQLIVDLGTIEERMIGEGLTVDRQADVVDLIGGLYRPLDLDLLEIVRADGRPLDRPLRASGVELAPAALVDSGERAVVTSRLLPTSDGRWLQTVVVTTRFGGEDYRLVGGYLFDDQYAFRLRSALGELGHVVLVVDDRVVGSTLVDPVSVPPGVARPGDPLPADAVSERIGGEDILVAYSPLRRPDSVDAALGVFLDDPGVPLDGALSDARLVAGVVLAGLSLLVGWLFFRALVRPLFALKDTAGRIAGGNLEATFQAAGSDEVADLARSLERMRLELRAQLALIGEQADALQHSSHRIVAAQDEERHRLARDLHDGIQQHLVVLRMGFGLAKEAAERSPETTSRSLAELGSELDAVIERLREVSHDLYPSILVDRGLAAALRSSLGRLPLCARLQCDPDPLPRLPPEIESGAYFLVGEAVANTLKHAEAGELVIALALTAGELRAVVRDDGHGFDTAASARRGGLLHMQDRARSFGGTLRIRSEPGAGTEVEATFPLCRPVPESTPAG